jgi:hypothetical protein
MLLVGCASTQGVSRQDPIPISASTANAPDVSDSRPQVVPQQAANPLVPDDFPQTIGDLLRVHTQDYGGSELGFSVKYRGDTGIIADVYVYDMGIAEIGTGHDLPEVTGQLEMATRDIYKMQALGAYSPVEKKGNPIVNLGDPKLGIRASGAVFTMVVQGQPVVSHVYLTGVRKKFLKIRCTYLFSEETEQENSERLRRFLVALGPVILGAK